MIKNKYNICANNICNNFIWKGHGDRYLGSLFRVGEPVTDDSLFDIYKDSIFKSNSSVRLKKGKTSSSDHSKQSS